MERRQLLVGSTATMAMAAFGLPVMASPTMPPAIDSVQVCRQLEQDLFRRMPGQMQTEALHSDSLSLWFGRSDLPVSAWTSDQSFVDNLVTIVADYCKGRKMRFVHLDLVFDCMFEPEVPHDPTRDIMSYRGHLFLFHNGFVGDPKPDLLES